MEKLSKRDSAVIGRFTVIKRIKCISETKSNYGMWKSKWTNYSGKLKIWKYFVEIFQKGFNE